MTQETVWISQYALSAGIKEHVAEIRDGKAYPGKPYMEYVGFKLGDTAHLTQREAIKVADTMRIKKIESLKKQIAKLEKMRF